MFDVLIIGAGFAGAATAFHLARDSRRRVLVVERESRAGVHASGKNAALLRQAVPSLVTARMIQETRNALLQTPQNFLRPVAFRQRGSLLLGETERLAQLHEVLQHAGAEGIIFRPGELPKNLDPSLSEMLRRRQYQALLASPGDGVVDVQALLDNYLAGARARGVEFQSDCEVRQTAREEDGWRVETSRGVFMTRLLVNAAGPWANQAMGESRYRLPELVSYRRHLMVTETPPQMKMSWPFVWDLADEFYFRPDEGGCLMCPGDEEPHPARTPECDPQALSWLEAKAEAFAPTWGRLAVRKSWSCLRSKTPSGLSYIDWDPVEPRLFWVGGLGGHGMSASYGIGRRAAEAIGRFFDAKDEVFCRKSVTG